MRRVLLLQLDAASAELIEKWTDDGSLPNLARLRKDGRYGRLGSFTDSLTESIPFAVYTGRNPAATGLSGYTMWQKETMRTRAPAADWLPYQPFWRGFGETGPRAVVLDPVNVYAPVPFNGMEITGWATHDTLVPFQSYPPALAGWVKRRFGANLLPDEKYGLQRQRDFLHDRQLMFLINERWARLCIALMRETPWDLMLAANLTLHHSGHRLWSTVNIEPSPSEADRIQLEGALHEVFVACDRALGDVIRAAGSDSTVLVFAAHGMGFNQSRNWIFPDMLRRVLGEAPASSGLTGSVRKRIPLDLRHAAKSLMPFQVRRWLSRYWNIRDYKWDQTRAFSLYSDPHGLVRINLKGREAEGIVEPGAEYESLCALISDGLKTFVDADTGQPIVRDIIRPHQAFAGKYLGDLPDLVVLWAETPAARHRAVTSPEFGTIPWPTPGHNPEGRSGNHRSQGFLIAAGPGIKSGTISGAHILDLAPTILSLLGQPVPGAMEGKAIKLTD